MENLSHVEEKEHQAQQGDFLSTSVHRRSFLKYAGAGAASVALLAAGCKKVRVVEGVYFGEGDIAILNYAYALEQLEAAFYIRVTASPYSGISAMETAYLTDIREHEVAHREFFKAALGASAIAGLEVDFSSIDFSSRASVLGTARAFEDLGVSAYNGAGWLIKDVNYLALAGKIVSVEARHAATIRDLITANSFAGADVVNQTNGLDTSRSPGQVLAIAGAYIKTKINVEGLPNY